MKQRPAVGAVKHGVVEFPAGQELDGKPIVSTRMTVRRGLVFVKGPAGSRKTTTLAALVDTINRREAQHIITITCIKKSR